MNQEQLGELTALVEETIAGHPRREGARRRRRRSSARFRRSLRRVVATALDVADVDAVFLPALEALPLVGILVVLWYGAHRVLAGDITIGTFALFNVYLVLLVFPLRTIGQRVSTVQRGAAAARRVVDVLRGARRPSSRRPRPRRSRRGATSASRTSASRYGDERADPRRLLARRSRPATSLALVGATGSGKSTVAALLARFYDPDGGRVTIGGVDVRELRARRAAARRRLVFEETFLFGDTVRGNVGFAIAGRRRRGDPPRRAARRRRGIRRAPARGLRDGARRARLLALGRPAAADRDRARDPRRPAGADPRRRDLGGRRDEGARDPRRARGGDGGPHDARDRASPGDDRARRPRRGASKAAGSSSRGRTPSCVARSPRYRALLALAEAEPRPARSAPIMRPHRRLVAWARRSRWSARPASRSRRRCS